MNFIFFLFGIVSFLSCLAAERDYQEDQQGGFWRQSLDIIFIKEGRELPIKPSKSDRPYRQEDIHRELKRFTILDRIHLENLQQQGKVKQALGNCASCATQYILEDGTSHLMFFGNNTGNENLGIKGFTTLRTTGDRKGFLSTSTDDLRDVRNWLFPEEDKQHRVLSYTDTELQIICELFVKKRLQSVFERMQNLVKVIIVHIYTEDDPCGWCSEAMVKTIEKVFQGKESLNNFIKKGGRLLFEVSSTRQHLHARESGCDEEYRDGQPVRIHLDKPPKNEKSVFFSRFSARESRQESSISFYRNTNFRKKTKTFEIKEGQEKISKKTSENLFGDSVPDNFKDVLTPNSITKEFYFRYSLYPLAHALGSKTEFDDYVSTLKKETGPIGKKVLYRSWLTPTNTTLRQDVAREQYRHSWHNLRRLESIEKQHQDIHGRLVVSDEIRIVEK